MISLRPVTHWIEKTKGIIGEGDECLPVGTVRIYCGSQWLGWAIPSEHSYKEELFNFDSFFKHLVESKKDKTLEQIKEHCELSIKEFLANILK